MDSLIHHKILVLWTDFVDMDREVFIKTQAQTLPQKEETTKSNVGRNQEGEGKAKEQEAEHKVEEAKG